VSPEYQRLESKHVPFFHRCSVIYP